MIDEVDQDGDGKINYDEFASSLRAEKKSVTN